MKKIICLFSCVLFIAVSIAMVGCDAKNTNQFTVKFDYNDGVTASIEKQVGENEKVNQPKCPIRDGYKFLGWYKKIDGVIETKPYDFLNTLVTSDFTLYASWSKNLGYQKSPDNLTYSINYDNNKLTLSATGIDGKLLEYSVNDSEYSTNNAYDISYSAKYLLRARYKQTELVRASDAVEARIVTKPSAENFTATPTPDEYESVTINSLDDKEYLYSADGEKWVEQNILSELSIFDEKLNIYVKLKAQPPYPSSEVTMLNDIAIPHRADRDIPTLLRLGWSSGGVYDFSLNEQRIGLNGASSQNSALITATDNSQTTTKTANLGILKPATAYGVKADILIIDKVDSTKNISVTVSGVGKPYGAIPSKEWATLYFPYYEEQGSCLLQISFTQDTLIYIDNVTPISQADIPSNESLEFGNHYSDFTKTENYMKYGTNSENASTAIKLNSGDTASIIANKPAEKYGVKVDILVLGDDRTSDFTVTLATNSQSRNIPLGKLKSKQWNTIYLPFFDGNGLQTQTLLQVTMGLDATVYLDNLIPITEAEYNADKDIMSSWKIGDDGCQMTQIANYFSDGLYNASSMRSVKMDITFSAVNYINIWAKDGENGIASVKVKVVSVTAGKEVKFNNRVVTPSEGWVQIDSSSNGTGLIQIVWTGDCSLYLDDIIYKV